MSALPSNFPGSQTHPVSYLGRPYGCPGLKVPSSLLRARRFQRPAAEDTKGRFRGSVVKRSRLRQAPGCVCVDPGPAPQCAGRDPMLDRQTDRVFLPVLHAALSLSRSPE